MGNFNYKYGETDPIMSAAVLSATVIDVGMAVFQLAGAGPINAGLIPWNTDLATTQIDAHTQFLGVAQQRSRAGDTDPIRVATHGVFEFPCVAATFNIGDVVGIGRAGVTNFLSDTLVIGGLTVARGIGRVVKKYTANTTTVLVAIESCVVWGGPHAIA